MYVYIYIYVYMYSLSNSCQHAAIAKAGNCQRILKKKQQHHVSNKIAFGCFLLLPDT